MLCAQLTRDLFAIAKFFSSLLRYDHGTDNGRMDGRTDDAPTSATIALKGGEHQKYRKRTECRDILINRYRIPNRLENREKPNTDIDFK